jgi:hypothetical protein
MIGPMLLATFYLILIFEYGSMVFLWGASIVFLWIHQSFNSNAKMFKAMIKLSGIVPLSILEVSKVWIHCLV